MAPIHIPSLLGLSLAASIALSTARAAADDSCPPGPDRTASDTPVHVVLFGYPYGPSDGQLPPLTAVDDDLLQMATFFSAMGPATLYVHGEPVPSMTRRFGDSLRAPTWRALRESLADLEARLREDGRRARVYVYFAGHGLRSRSEQGSDLSGHIFARPEPGATERGHDGVLTGAMLAEHIYKPLSAHGEVNLIADACQSFYLLTARGRFTRHRRAPPPLPDYADRFALLFPAVGASLATEGITYEDSTGGLFSHAIRSVGIGPADLDQDGIITYGEFHYALNWILSATPSASEATVVPPGMDPTAAFIDWRGSAAARVCIPPALAGRRLVATDDGLSATLHLAPTASFPVWLETGRRYALLGKESQIGFVAGDGPLVGLRTEGIAQRGERWPTLFSKPIAVSTAPSTLASAEDGATLYHGIGLVGAFGFLTADPSGGETTRWVPAADLSGRLGLGADRLIAEVGWMWLRAPSQSGRTARGAEAPIAGDDYHAISGRLGYEHLLFDRTWQLGLGALIGGTVPVDATGPRPVLPEATARLTALRPIGDGRFALRFDARVALTPSESGVASLLRVGAGVDFESL